MFVISKNSLYRGSIPYILLQLWPGHRISFVISRTSLNRGSLNRGSTVYLHSTYQTCQSSYVCQQEVAKHQGIRRYQSATLA